MPLGLTVCLFVVVVVWFFFWGGRGLGEGLFVRCLGFFFVVLFCFLFVCLLLFWSGNLSIPSIHLRPHNYRRRCVLDFFVASTKMECDHLNG